MKHFITLKFHELIAVGVGSNRKRLQCTMCLTLTHASCATIPKYEQTKISAKTIKLWTCEDCTLSELPFFNLRDINSSFNCQPGDESNLKPADLLITKDNPNSTSIAHLNVQSLMSTFNEFGVMVNDRNFDIIALTETWLTDSKQQLDYVQLPGYVTEFRSRVGKKGGGVGFYVKEEITFKPRRDLTRTCELEVLFIEIVGRNKNTPSLICVAYQLS